MQIDELRNFCIAKKAVTEHFPLDDVTLVFKVFNKMFALVGIDAWEVGEQKINLKCLPEKAVELREEYEGINPGWHMNKKHWNKVTINNSDVSDDLVRELINHSYEQLIKSFPKKVQRELEDL